MQLTLSISFTLIFLIRVSYGYSSGAGTTACEGSSLLPNHYGTSPQTGSSLYRIELSSNTYEAGGTITVVLRGATFKGFLVMALPETDDTASPVGTFGLAQNANAEDLNKDLCIGGATHTDAFSSSSPPSDYISLQWTAPNSPPINLIFYATFVQARSTYWVKLPSSVLAPEADSSSSSTSSMTSMTSAASDTGSTASQSSTSPSATAGSSPSATAGSSPSATTNSSASVNTGSTVSTTSSTAGALHSDAQPVHRLGSATFLLCFITLLLAHL